MGSRGRGISGQCLLGDPILESTKSPPSAATAIGSFAHLGVLRVLVNEVRLQILECLSQREYDVTDLTDRLELDIRKISHDLKQLHAHGLVEFRRVKTRHIYRTSDALSLCVCQRTLCVAVTFAGRFPIRVAVERTESVGASPPPPIDEYRTKAQTDSATHVEPKAVPARARARHQRSAM